MIINYWATSDWHLGHRKIRDYCPSRPENHEEVILANYRALVLPQDYVFFLGDMVLRWGKEGKMWWNQIHDLPGRKILVRGNHDHGSDNKLKTLGGFERVEGEMLKLYTPPHYLLLSHVPMIPTPYDNRYNGWRRRVREEFETGQYVFNVHGHTHEKNTGDSQCVNVSVENTSFRPVLLYVDRTAL